MEEIFERVQELHKKKLAFVAIDGMQGAGKTTLVRHIISTVPDVQILYLDNFYRGPEKKDHTRILPDVIQPLKDGKTAHFQIYDWSTDKIIDAKPILPNGIILVEGTYAMDKRLISEYDLTIWVKCPWEVGLKRALVRDNYDFQDLWEEKWVPEAREYVKRQQPHRKSDIVIGYKNIPAFT